MYREGTATLPQSDPPPLQLAPVLPRQGDFALTLRSLLWYVPGYAITYWLGIEFYYKSASATTLWLTNGFVLAALLLVPRKRWPAIIAAGMLTHCAMYYSTHAMSSAWGIQTALIDTGEAIVGAYLTQRWIRRDFDISRLKHTLALMGAIIVAAGFMALFAGEVIAGQTSGPGYWKAWRLWWYGDMVGDIILAPLILAWARVDFAALRNVHIDRVAEAILVTGSTLAVLYLSFDTHMGILPANWLLPVLLWASLRFHPRFVLLLSMLATVFAVETSIQGHGPFVNDKEPIINMVLSLQSYVAVLAASMLFVSSLTSDRNRILHLHMEAEAGMRKLNTELEQRVEVRTVQLQEANRDLRSEMNVRAGVEATLRARNEELKAFAYTVSHDLKAPLRGIAGYTQELERKHFQATNERAAFCLQQIQTATRNLDTLIEELLRYSRYDAEQPVFAPADLAEIVDRILVDRAHEINSRGVVVRTSMEVVSVVEWERGLSQILANLIDNAIKYTRRSDPPIISISSEAAGPNVRLCVADNGIGFEMKYHDRLYGLFNRLVHHDEFEGTGAGLAIAKKLVEKCGGRIWATSEPGRGATFTVEMPVRNPDNRD